MHAKHTLPCSTCVSIVMLTFFLMLTYFLLIMECACRSLCICYITFIYLHNVLIDVNTHFKGTCAMNLSVFS